MKKVLLSIFSILLMTIAANAATTQDVINFFNNYVYAANTYSTSIPDMYSNDAKIIRQVVKPDGTTANAYTDKATYIKQMKLSQAVAKARKYTNSYSNIAVEDLGNGKYKISALRQPKGETYKLKTYMIVTQKPDGKWQIIEEMMQTKEQIFLKYAKQN